MNIIQVQKAPVEQSDSSLDLFERACLLSLYYPSRSPEEYMHMSMKKTKTMLRVARRLDAYRFNALLDIVTAPATTNPRKSVENIRNNFKEAQSV